MEMQHKLNFDTRKSITIETFAKNMMLGEVLTHWFEPNAK
jgi:hypothetical protein